MMRSLLVGVGVFACALAVIGTAGCGGGDDNDDRDVGEGAGDDGEGEAGEGEGEAGEGEGEAGEGEGEREPPALSCGADLPTPSDACIAASCGNEIGVGQPCTQGGRECERFPFGQAGICTADHDETELLFCTKPCLNDGDCGSDAVCAVDPENPLSRGCIRTACE
jgi:hypothetical protein